MFDFKDQGEINIDGESSVPVIDFRAFVQFVDVGWQLDNYLDSVDTEQDDSNEFEMPILFAVEFFIKQNAWPASSQNYLINEHNDRTRLKEIVYKAMLDHNQMSVF